VGSNIFDILFGLPFPWLCYCVYFGACSWQSVQVNKGETRLRH
jgi:hypothetical protein